MTKTERAGRRLRTWRKTKGLRLHHVAALLGRSESYASRLERGMRVPSLGLAVKIQDIAGVEVTSWR